MSAGPFDARDLEALSERGIARRTAVEQLARLRAPFEPLWVVRPATPGDGIHVLAPETWTAYERERAWKDSFARFVPASGAATRMFGELLEGLDALRVADARDARAATHPAVDRFLTALPASPFAELDPGGDDPRRRLETLLAGSGPALASLPKVLLPFHRENGRVRTALEQQLREAAGVVGEGHALVHLTVSGEHEMAIVEACDRLARRIEDETGVRLTVSTSRQSPSTDTIALDEDGAPFRDAEGRLVFRPSGHGALIENLDDLDADHVFVKNVDNVGPGLRRDAAIAWTRRLFGLLIATERRVHDALDRLRAGSRDREGLLGLAAQFGWSFDPSGETAGDERWIDRLDRPIRIAGMVRNTGEPGGGPFWVDGPEGVVVQIVEGAQLDLSNELQRDRFEAGTHFNPVFLALSKKRAAGGRHALGRFVDPDAVLRIRRSYAGRPLTALERPGLWNGAMARWNSLFVEVPDELFQPVKSVFDLLAPPHA